MKNNTTILIILTIGIVLSGIILYQRGQQDNKQILNSNTLNTSQKEDDETMKGADMKTTENQDTTPDNANNEVTNNGAMEERTSPNALVIQNYAFSPNYITVKKGTTLTWTNNDTARHNVVADDGSFEGNLLAKGESYSRTFDKVGTFNYHCAPHPYMKAIVKVVE